MRKLTFAAVTIAFGALVAVAPASAERNPGPLVQNGQCWNTQVNHGGSSVGTWGYWSACPQTASATTTTTPRHHRRHHSASR